VWGPQQSDGCYPEIGLIYWSAGLKERTTESQKCRGWKGPLEIVDSNRPVKQGIQMSSFLLDVKFKALLTHFFSLYTETHAHIYESMFHSL